MTSINIRAETRQGQNLSPRLQHAVRLLQMSSLDFAAMVRDTLVNNPFLEVEESEDADDSQMQDLASLFDARRKADSDGDGDVSSEVDTDRDLWHADIGGSAQGKGDGDTSPLDSMAVETSLNEHLHGQLNVAPLSWRELAIARMIVESLDDDGYLRTPLEDLLVVVTLDPPAKLEELETALHRVQSLDPAGVGARSVSECLTLQLPAILCPDMRALAGAIVRQHLPALAARDMVGLARQLDESPARVVDVCDRIRRLDPRPGWRVGSSRVAYVVPDVLVRKVRGDWQVHLNTAIVPKVRLNEVCAQLFQRHRSPQHAALGAHLQEARWTLRNVEQRFSTILDVADAIVKRQRNFLDYGTMAMKPLGLREIADEVGVHESTVSRVTNNKYIATPAGVFELKYFFSRAMVSANGSECSGTAIRSLLKDIIDAEDLLAPLSDAEIARQLAGQGLVVARRTVTKYRQMLKIEAVERRRRHAPANPPGNITETGC